MEGGGKRKVCVVTGASRGIGRGVSWINTFPNELIFKEKVQQIFFILPEIYKFLLCEKKWSVKLSNYQIALQLGSERARVYITGMRLSQRVGNGKKL